MQAIKILLLVVDQLNVKWRKRVKREIERQQHRASKHGLLCAFEVEK